MSQVMQKLHCLFVRVKDSRGTIPYGISFPRYDKQKPTLGDQLRLHGEDKYFASLDVLGALSFLKDYVHITSPRIIPEAKQKGFVAYSRLRHDHGKEKLIRRSMKRHGVSREKAEALYLEYQQHKFPNCPFVMMRSSSTGRNVYPLYLDQHFLDSQGRGGFNTFGISPSFGVERF
jgi:CRISPR-associated endonuclease Csy4